MYTLFFQIHRIIDSEIKGKVSVCYLIIIFRDETLDIFEVVMGIKMRDNGLM